MTPQNAASHLGLFCLLRGYSSKNEIKKNRFAPGAHKTRSGIAQMIGMGKSIRQNWVNICNSCKRNCLSDMNPSRHLTSVGRQIDVRLRRHNDVGFRLILKVCLTSKTDVILTSKTDVILTSEKQRWFDVSNVTS